MITARTSDEGTPTSFAAVSPADGRVRRARNRRRRCLTSNGASARLPRPCLRRTNIRPEQLVSRPRPTRARHPESGPREVIPRLAEVRVGENETFESALRRFNKKIQQSGILAEARRREHYEKPSVKRKRKEAKRKKNARTQVG